MGTVLCKLFRYFYAISLSHKSGVVNIVFRFVSFRIHLSSMGPWVQHLKINFTSRPRTGIKAVVPSLQKGVAAYHQSLYDNSFAVIGPHLWNCLLSYINRMEELTSLLRQIPDQSPV